MNKTMCFTLSKKESKVLLEFLCSYESPMLDDPAIQNIISRLRKASIDFDNQEAMKAEQEITETLCTILKRDLSQIEIGMIQKWIYEDRLSIDKIREVLLNSVRIDKVQIGFMDMALQKVKQAKFSNDNRFTKQRSPALVAILAEWDEAAKS